MEIARGMQARSHFLRGRVADCFTIFRMTLQNDPPLARTQNRGNFRNEGRTCTVRHGSARKSAGNRRKMKKIQ